MTNFYTKHNDLIVNDNGVQEVLVAGVSAYASDGLKRRATEYLDRIAAELTVAYNAGDMDKAQQLIMAAEAKIDEANEAHANYGTVSFA